MSPLHLVASRGHFLLLPHLAKSRDSFLVALHLRDAEGATALWRAAQKGQLEVVPGFSLKVGKDGKIWKVWGWSTKRQRLCVFNIKFPQNSGHMEMLMSYSGRKISPKKSARHAFF